MRGRVVFGPVVGHWVAAQMNGAYSPAIGTAIGCVDRDGHIIAGCFFENFNGASMTAHLAIKGRITREFLWTLADYAFRQCKVKKLIAPVASSNLPMVELAENMGFWLEAYIEDAHPDGAISLYTMTADQCRFLGDQYCGKTFSAKIA